MLLGQFVTPHSVSYVEVFLLCMLKIGELDINTVEQLDLIGDLPNLKRLMLHVQVAYPVDIIKMID